MSDGLKVQCQVPEAYARVDQSSPSTIAVFMARRDLVYLFVVLFSSSSMYDHDHRCHDIAVVEHLVPYQMGIMDDWINCEMTARRRQGAQLCMRRTTRKFQSASNPCVPFLASFSVYIDASIVILGWFRTLESCRVEHLAKEVNHLTFCKKNVPDPES